MDRKEDIQKYYVCGWCRTKIYYLATEEPTVPCPECGWYHKERKYRDIPAEVMVDLNKY